MTYRDDREALHNRVANLEQELEEAKRAGAQQGRDEAASRAAALEQKVGAMRGELQQMEAELQAMRGEAPPARAPNTAATIAVLIVLIVFCGAGGFWLFVLRDQTPPPEVVVTSPTAVPSPPPIPRTEEPAKPLAPAPAPTPDKPAPEPRTAKARWSAKVSHAEGMSLAAGATCTIDATMATADTNVLVKELIVTCGGQKLYRSSDGLNGMAQMSNDAREILGASDDKGTFSISYRDIGSRTGERTQVDLDSRQHQGTVFRETIPRFRVDFTIPTASNPTDALARSEQRLKRSGKFTLTTGTASVKDGTSCVLRAMPNGKGRDCVAELACGATVLWPATAQAKCEYDESSRPTSISADGLMLDGSTVTLTTKSFAATVTLD